MADSTSTLKVEVLSDLEITMTRTFNAPRDLVFEAHSKCEHIEKWWGQRESPMSVCELDFRPGGKWRFVQKSPTGEEWGFRGEFKEILPPEKIVWTFEFEGMPGHISVDTLTLTEEKGKTTLTAVTRFDSKEDRDEMLQSGMEAGANETWDRLEEYLQTMK